MRFLLAVFALPVVLACGSHAVTDPVHQNRGRQAISTNSTEGVATANDNTPFIPIVRDEQQDEIDAASCKAYKICVSHLGTSKCSEPSEGC